MLALAGILLVTAVLAVVTHPLPSDDPLFLSPHENVRWELAKQWVETGRPAYDLPAFDRLPADIAPALTPRDASLQDGQIVPKDFPYAVGLVALLQVIAPELALLLTVVATVALLVLTALLGRELTGSPLAAVIATAIVATSTAFWAGSVGRIETGGVSAALAVGGVLALCRARRASEARERANETASEARERANETASEAPPLALLAIGGACFGLAVGFHHGSVVLVGGLGLAFALLSARPLRWAVGIGGAAGVALLPLLAYNTWMFGSPIRTGYGAVSAFYGAAEARSSGSVFRFDLDSLASHVWRYWLRPEVLLVVAVAVVGGRVLLRRSSAPRPVVLALGIGALPYLVFMGARPLFGSDGFALNASFLRYGLPVFVIVAVLASGAVLARTRRARRLSGLTIGLAVVVALGTILAGNLGPRPLGREFDYSSRSTRQLFDATPENALVITGKQDKFLWPERSTLTAAFLVDRQQRSGDYLGDLVPDPQRLADVVARLVTAGEVVYLWDPGGWFASDPEKLPQLDVQLAAVGVVRTAEPLVGLSSFAAA